MALARADRMPSIRQLYEISELGKPAGEPTRTPEFLRFVVAPEQPRIPGEQLDFRDEMMAQIYDRGDPTPKRTLTFVIEVTDEGRTSGLPVRERRTFQQLEADRPHRVRPRGGVIQRGRGDPFQPPDLARRPQRSGDRYPGERAQGALTAESCSTVEKRSIRPPTVPNRRVGR